MTNRYLLAQKVASHCMVHFYNQIYKNIMDSVLVTEELIKVESV